MTGGVTSHTMITGQTGNASIYTEQGACPPQMAGCVVNLWALVNITTTPHPSGAAAWRLTDPLPLHQTATSQLLACFNIYRSIEIGKGKQPSWWEWSGHWIPFVTICGLAGRTNQDCNFKSLPLLMPQEGKDLIWIYTGEVFSFPKFDQKTADNPCEKNLLGRLEAWMTLDINVLTWSLHTRWW